MILPECWHVRLEVKLSRDVTMLVENNLFGVELVRLVLVYFQVVVDTDAIEDTWDYDA